MAETWTVRRVLQWTSQHFEKQGVDVPRLTAEILLAHSLKTDRVRLYVDLDRPLTPDELAGYRSLIARRSTGEPTQYLTGLRDFYNRKFQVDARVLVPRPETEMLVEAVLHLIPADAPFRILDLCTGSGCIAITLAAERKQTSVWATDISKGALEVAALNAETLNVGSRVSFFEGDLFGALPAGAQFDVIVSNPPYISTAEIATLSKEVQREPVLALDGGADGLNAIRSIAASAKGFLKAGATLALEIGETQGPAVLGLLQAAGYQNVRVERDLERRDRFAFATP